MFSFAACSASSFLASSSDCKSVHIGSTGLSISSTVGFSAAGAFSSLGSSLLGSSCLVFSSFFVNLPSIDLASISSQALFANKFFQAKSHFAISVFNVSILCSKSLLAFFKLSILDLIPAFFSSISDFFASNSSNFLISSTSKFFTSDFCIFSSSAITDLVFSSLSISVTCSSSSEIFFSL